MNSNKIKEVVKSIIFLPSKLNLNDKSVYHLLKDSGYFEVFSKITVDVIRNILIDHAECIEDWLIYSQNKRSSGWYFKEDLDRGYVVGCFGETCKNDLIGYSDKVEACANYIIKEIEDIRS